MFGAIAGDVIGSAYEFRGLKATDFPLFVPETTFTDDSVMTVATAAALLGDRDYAAAYRDFGDRYPGRGYGARFQQWLLAHGMGPYGSFGNGSAMRVSPVGYAAQSVAAVLAESERSAAVSHDHPEGIRGAQATALAVFLARTGTPKWEIRDEIGLRFAYDLTRTVAAIRPTYEFNETCQATVPEGLICFLESTDWEDAVRKAISLGGDADTLAAIAGAVAEAHYGGVPESLGNRVWTLLPDEFHEVMERFRRRFGSPDAPRRTPAD